jgi:hypothetical protein
MFVPLSAHLHASHANQQPTQHQLSCCISPTILPHRLTSRRSVGRSILHETIKNALLKFSLKNFWYLCQYFFGLGLDLTSKAYLLNILESFQELKNEYLLEAKGLCLALVNFDARTAQGA